MPYRVIVTVDDFEEARMVVSEIYDRFGLRAQVGAFGESDDRFDDSNYDSDDFEE